MSLMGAGFYLIIHVLMENIENKVINWIIFLVGFGFTFTMNELFQAWFWILFIGFHFYHSFRGRSGDATGYGVDDD